MKTIWFSFPLYVCACVVTVLYFYVLNCAFAQ